MGMTKHMRISLRMEQHIMQLRLALFICRPLSYKSDQDDMYILQSNRFVNKKI